MCANTGQLLVRTVHFGTEWLLYYLDVFVYIFEK